MGCFWKLKKLIHKSNGFDYCWLARRIQDLNVPAASNLPTILPWVFWSPKAKELKERPEGRIHIRCRHLHFQSLKTCQKEGIKSIFIYRKLILFLKNRNPSVSWVSICPSIFVWKLQEL